MELADGQVQPDVKKDAHDIPPNGTYAIEMVGVTS
jgi:hypothetical protein